MSARSTGCSAFALVLPTTTPPGASVVAYVSTWTGFVYVAFVIDTVDRRVGWRASRTAHAGFVLDALEQALHEPRPARGDGLIHISDRDSQNVSIKYNERLVEAGIEPSVGSIGDSYDNALAETINGLGGFEGPPGSAPVDTGCVTQTKQPRAIPGRFSPRTAVLALAWW